MSESIPNWNEINKRVITSINKKEYTEATLLTYAQLKKGNKIILAWKNNPSKKWLSNKL